MHAILRNEHQKFCAWVQGIKNKQESPDPMIHELEVELKNMYWEYQQKAEALKLLIQDYEQKQKAIKNRIKRNMKLSQNYKKKFAVQAVATET